MVQQTSKEGTRVLVLHPQTEKNYVFSETSFRILQKVEPGMDTRALLTSVMVGEPSPEIIAKTDRLIQAAATAGLFATAATEDAAKPLPANGTHPRTSWNPIYIKIPLFNPQRINPVLQPFATGLFSLPAVAIWIAGMSSAIFLLKANWLDFLHSFSVFPHFTFWPVVYLIAAASGLLHEMGHVLACRRFRVEVKSVGLLFYFFNPGAFSDISGAWMLPDRWQRIVISLGGLYLEALVWMAAVFTWHFAPETIASNIAFVTMIVLSPRFLFNLVPLLRLDGYWVLCDLLQMNNLRAKSFGYLLSKLPVTGTAFRPWRKPSRTESIILLGYGVSALAFIILMLRVAVHSLHGWMVDRFPVFGTVACYAVVAAVAVLVFPHLRREMQALSRAQRGI